MYDCNYVIDTPGTFHGLISGSHRFTRAGGPDKCQTLVLRKSHQVVFAPGFTYVSLG